MTSFALWGLDRSAETIYRTLLRNPSIGDPATLADRLGFDPDQVHSTLARLTDLGLLTRSGQTVAPVAPGAALTALLHDEMRTIDSRRAQIDALRADLAGFSADHIVGQTHAWSHAPFEVLSLDEAAVAIEDAQRSTVGEVLSCHPAADPNRSSTPFNDLVEQQLRNGRPMRGVYPLDVLSEPHRHAWVQRWARAGERVRLINDPLPPMAVFGADCAMIAVAWAGGPGLIGSAGIILVRAPAIVAITAQLFEHVWAGGIPLGSDNDGTAAAERRRLIELLALGVKDEAIARHLDLSLRTVRRRISELLAELNADTRFQAGLEAGRRGLL